jgi:hypothetical protein
MMVLVKENQEMKRTGTTLQGMRLTCIAGAHQFDVAPASGRKNDPAPTRFNSKFHKVIPA